MMLHPELLRAAAYSPVRLTAATALLLAVSVTHLGQVVLLAGAFSALGRGDHDELPWLLGGVAAVMGMRLLLNLAQRQIAAAAGAQIRARLRDALLDGLGGLGPTYVTGARAGKVRATLVDGVDGIETYVAKYLPQLVIAVLVPPLLLLWAAVLLPSAAIALGVALAVALLAPRWWDRLLAGRGREHWETYEALAADYLEALQAMATLRAAGAVGRVRTRLRHRSDALHRATVAKLRVSLIDTGITDLAIQGGMLAAVTMAAHAAATAGAHDATTYLLLLLAGEAFRPVRELARQWHAGYLGISAADGLRQLRTARPAVPDSGVAAADWTSQTGAPFLEFDRVTFTHPGSDRPALHNVSFTVAHGSAVAVVGPSGAGKSTLVALLTRQHDPDSGCIRLNGADIRNLSLASLREGIATVSQDTYLFHASVADNLRLADPEATDARLADACRTAGIHQEIAALPLGYATVLGERGATLSGGQRQRLALARALLADAPLLVLDEATSAVDGNREETIMRGLKHQGRRRTQLLITHRLASVRDLDRIVVLDRGSVSESGDHLSLAAADGAYASLLAADRRR